VSFCEHIFKAQHCCSVGTVCQLYVKNLIVLALDPCMSIPFGQVLLYAKLLVHSVTFRGRPSTSYKLA